MPASTWRRSAHAALAAIALIGCGGSKGASSNAGEAEPTSGAMTERDDFRAACDRREKEHLCNDFFGMATKSWVQGECAGYGGTVLDGRCPTDQAVGRCVRNVGTASELHEVFYPPLTKETLDALCRGDGTEKRAP